MAEGEQERFELLNSLIEVHGEDVARKLMDSLPPFSWDQVATKDDLKALSTAITAKFDQVDAQFTAVAAEFVNLRGEISKEVAGLSIKIGELDSKFSKKITEASSTAVSPRRSRSRLEVMVLTMAGFFRCWSELLGGQEDRDADGDVITACHNERPNVSAAFVRQIREPRVDRCESLSELFVARTGTSSRCSW